MKLNTNCELLRFNTQIGKFVPSGITGKVVGFATHVLEYDSELRSKVIVKLDRQFWAHIRKGSDNLHLEDFKEFELGSELIVMDQDNLLMDGE